MCRNPADFQPRPFVAPRDCSCEHTFPRLDRSWPVFLQPYLPPPPFEALFVIPWDLTWRAWVLGPLRDPCGPDLRDPSRNELFCGGWTLRDPMALPGVHEGDAPLGWSLDSFGRRVAMRLWMVYRIPWLWRGHECLVSIFASLPSWEVKPLAASDGPRYIAHLVTG